jgi:hypothetical protein
MVASRVRHLWITMIHVTTKIVLVWAPCGSLAYVCWVPHRSSQYTCTHPKNARTQTLCLVTTSQLYNIQFLLACFLHAGMELFFFFGFLETHHAVYGVVTNRYGHSIWWNRSALIISLFLNRWCDGLGNVCTHILMEYEWKKTFCAKSSAILDANWLLHSTTKKWR